MADFQITQTGAELQAILDGNVGLCNALYNTGHSAALKPVNQRDFDGNWAGLAIGDYGYDGWLKYSATHKAQVIELGDFESIDYVISYDGVSAGTITPPNGIAEPWLVAIPFAVDKIDLRPSEGFGYWQAEDAGTKTAKAQRYYFDSKDFDASQWSGDTTNGIAYAASVPLPTSMRVPPLTVTANMANQANFAGGVITVLAQSSSYVLLQAVSTATGSGSYYRGNLVVDASFTIADAGTNISEVG